MQEIQDDVIEECGKYGGVVHIRIDQESPEGNIFVKCPSIAVATATVNGLNGRFFSGTVDISKQEQFINDQFNRFVSFQASKSRPFSFHSSPTTSNFPTRSAQFSFYSPRADQSRRDQENTRVRRRQRRRERRGKVEVEQQ